MKIAKVSRRRYEQVKRLAKTPADECRVAKAHHLGVTTVDKIRRSKNYADYRRKYAGNHEKRGRSPECILRPDDGKVAATVFNRQLSAMCAAIIKAIIPEVDDENKR